MNHDFDTQGLFVIQSLHRLLKKKHFEAEFPRPKNGNVIVNGIEYCFPMEIQF